MIRTHSPSQSPAVVSPSPVARPGRARAPTASSKRPVLAHGRVLRPAARPNVTLAVTAQSSTTSTYCPQLGSAVLQPGSQVSRFSFLVSLHTHRDWGRQSIVCPARFAAFSRSVSAPARAQRQRQLLVLLLVLLRTHPTPRPSPPNRAAPPKTTCVDFAGPVRPFWMQRLLTRCVDPGAAWRRLIQDATPCPRYISAASPILVCILIDAPVRQCLSASLHSGGD